ncbi:MAG: hypothetical protein Q7K54_03655 [Candidatus Parcubacteria bacterium]|nr:hypothetical protein [Candidatus Parcubacteria bacterium]
MKSEIKNCQNCKEDFTIEVEDFNFYEKIKVPPPTFCPECRLVRRFVWRNERTLYRRTCDLCKKNIVAMHDMSVQFPVYCHQCWHSDEWDAFLYGREYDMSRSFFDQYKDLLCVVPRLALWQRKVVNSEYSNMTAESKNVYLSVSVVADCENIFYSKTVDKSTDIIDCSNIKEGQNLYENIEGERNYNSQYLLLSRSCIDSYYLVDCVNCSNCVLSYNLRNKEFFIRNKQYSKENYFKEIEKLNLKSRISREKLLIEFKEIKKRAIYRFSNMVRSIGSTGNNLFNVKNCKSCFDVYDSENLKYCYRLLSSCKDSMDVNFAMKSELIYEYSTGALNDYNVRFSYSAMNFTTNAEYTDSCFNCDNIFGCIGLKNKEYAIFNKIYSKEEFNKIRKEIIEQMNNIPYKDKKGRIYRYGEFFPIEFSPWAYNETLAQDFSPLSKEESEENGYLWKDSDIKNFQSTISTEDIPDTIDEVDEDILKEILACKHKGNCNHRCSTVFRLTNYELTFYKKNKIPIPIVCPNCRYYERFVCIPELRLYKRDCMCDKTGHFHGEEKCIIEFETPYSPERPEIIYCEKCYQQEVY